MDKEQKVNSWVIFDTELTIFDECLHRGWVMGKDCKREKKLRITLRVSSLGEWVDNDVINENDNKEVI